MTLLPAIEQLIEAIDYRRRRVTGPLQARLEAALRAAFVLQGEQFLQLYLPGTDWEMALRSAQSTTQPRILSPLEGAVRAAIQAGGDALYGSLLISGSFDLENPRAVEYLRVHGAELVAHIDETTREQVRTIIADGREQGWSYDKTARALLDRFQEFAEGRPQLHIDSRAHGIAVTEIGNAYEAGASQVADRMQKLGLAVEKSWLTTQSGRVCSDICEANEKQGWIPYNAAFQSGHMQPLGHPYCMCTALYRRVTAETQE
jgi:hypothetical protein